MLISKIERMTLILVYIIIHIAVIFCSQLEKSWHHFPLSWTYQFNIAVLLMMLISCFMPFLKSTATCQGLLWLRLIITGILTVPTASYLGSFGLIYMVLIFDGFLYCPGLAAYIPGIFCIACSILLTYLRFPLWTKPANPIDFNVFTYTLIGSGFSFVVSFLFRRERKRQCRMLNEFQALQSSNQYLAETNTRLQNMVTEIESTITFCERNRIAREIHDTVAYTLTNLLSLLDAYRERLQYNLQEIPEELNQARSLIRDGLGDLRSILRGLRSKEKEDYNGLGMVKRLVTVFSQATGITVMLEYGDAPQYPGKDIEEVLYRVVQEGLTNAFRHGLATEVFVHFQQLKSGIGLSIRDNGRGTDTFSGGFGLLGITERVEALGGSVNLASQLGNGFTLKVSLPIRKEDGDRDDITVSDS